MAAKRVLTIGEVLVEIVATTKGNGFLEAQPLVGPFPSGAPAIFVDQVARIGGKAAIISRVGDDDFGRLNLDRLRKDGVDISGIGVAPGESTGSAFVRYREDGSRAFVYNIVDSAYGRLNLSPEAEAVIASCDHMHVMGTALTSDTLSGIVLEAIARIKARGGTLSFDPNLRSEILVNHELRGRLEQVLNQTDIFMPSGDEIFLFVESQTVDGAVDELLKRGIPQILLKGGSEGLRYFSANGAMRADPILVEEIDPTGAGDCCGGAFIGLLMNGASTAEALKYANAAGAYAVTQLGPMEGVVTRTMLDEFLKKHGL